MLSLRGQSRKWSIRCGVIFLLKVGYGESPLTSNIQFPALPVSGGSAAFSMGDGSSRPGFSIVPPRLIPVSQFTRRPATMPSPLSTKSTSTDIVLLCKGKSYCGHHRGCVSQTIHSLTTLLSHSSNSCFLRQSLCLSKHIAQTVYTIILITGAVTEWAGNQTTLALLLAWSALLSGMKARVQEKKDLHCTVTTSRPKLPMYLGVSQRWQIQKLLCIHHFYCKIH